MAKVNIKEIFDIIDLDDVEYSIIPYDVDFFNKVNSFAEEIANYEYDLSNEEDILKISKIGKKYLKYLTSFRKTLSQKINKINNQIDMNI